MAVKKINAILSLLTIIAILIHVGYMVFSYLTFYYNPQLNIVTSIPFIVLACLHAVLGMSIVFLQSDGTRLDIYPKQNIQTIVQRVTAALIFPMLILHINTFEMLQSCSEGGKWVLFYLLLAAQAVFYGTVTAHIAVSFSRALITLGWLKSIEKKKTIDRVVYVVCALIFLVSVWAVTKAQLAVFLPKGGAA